MGLIITSSRATGVFQQSNFITISKDLGSIDMTFDCISVTYSPGSGGSDLLPSALNWNAGLKKISGNINVTTPSPIDIVNSCTSLSGASPDNYQFEIIEPIYSALTINCSYNLIIQDNSIINNPYLSNRGYITYYIKVNNVYIELSTISVGDSFILNGSNYQVGTYDLKAVYRVRENSDLGSAIIFESSYEDTIDIVEYKPEMTLSFENDTSCAGDCNNAYFNIPVFVTATFNTNKTTGTSELVFELYDKDGTLIDTSDTIVIDNTDPDAASPLYTFTPEYIGDYKVVATLTNECSACVQEIVIKGCLQQQIVSKGCKTYAVKNCSITDSFKFSLLNHERIVYEDYSLLEVFPTTEVSFSVPSDGIYYVRLFDMSNVFIQEYVVIEYCDIISCVSSKLQSILCPKQSPCDDYCESRYNMNRILPLVYLIFNYINKEYSLNQIYTIINDAKVIELSNIQDAIEILTDICKDCTSKNISGIPGSSKPSGQGGCGCGCS